MNKFLKTAGICAVLTAITTFLLWLLPKFYGDVSTESDKIMLSINPFYMSRLWINFIHVFLALVGYLGAAVIIFQQSRGLALSGFMWFLLWGFTELLGLSVLIFAVNGSWRRDYMGANEAEQVMLKQNIDLFMQIWDSMFFLLLVFFLLGTLFYGLAIWRSQGLEKLLSLLFLLGVPLTIFITVSGYGGPVWPGLVAGWIYPVLQPFSRFVLGIWIWKKIIK